MFELRAARLVLMERCVELYVADFYVPASSGRRSASVMNMDLYGLGPRTRRWRRVDADSGTRVEADFGYRPKLTRLELEGAC